MPKTDSDDVKMAVMQNDLTYVKDTVTKLDAKISNGYVTKEEFDPIKKIVYGVVSLILVAVVGALVALVVGAQSR